MSNTLPILGTNNLGLTFKLPRWDRRLGYNAGSVVIFDTNPSDSDVEYKLFILPIEDKPPYADSDTRTSIQPDSDTDWKEFNVT